jgi:hypothetical protein
MGPWDDNSRRIDVIKFMQCVRRKAGLSVVEFRRYWEAYREKVQALAEGSRAVRFATSTALSVEPNVRVAMSRGTDEPYDGVVEIWWETGPDALEVLNRPDTQAQIADIRRLQEEFINLKGSSFFFCAEEVHLDRKAEG